MIWSIIITCITFTLLGHVFYKDMKETINEEGRERISVDEIGAVIGADLIVSVVVFLLSYFIVIPIIFETVLIMKLVFG